MDSPQVFESTEEPQSLIAEQPHAQIGEESQPPIAEESQPRIAEESQPPIVEESQPLIVEESQPRIVEESQPLIGKEDGSVDVMAQGLAAVLGPVVRDFDARVEGALKSQSLLTGSIDRLTKELDKLLEDTPIPMVAQHAAKLSGVRKRMASLMSTLRVVQGRIIKMDRMLNAREASTRPRATPPPSPLPSPSRPPENSAPGPSESKESVQGPSEIHDSAA